jgi:hypothetical protein
MRCRIDDLTNSLKRGNAYEPGKPRGLFTHLGITALDKTKHRGIPFYAISSGRDQLDKYGLMQEAGFATAGRVGFKLQEKTRPAAAEMAGLEDATGLDEDATPRPEVAAAPDTAKEVVETQPGAGK